MYIFAFTTVKTLSDNENQQRLSILLLFLFYQEAGLIRYCLKYNNVKVPDVPGLFFCLKL